MATKTGKHRGQLKDDDVASLGGTTIAGYFMSWKKVVSVEF